MTPTPEERAQLAAEEHLQACWAYENGDTDEEPDTAGPFCGCLTCEVREVLHAAWPHLQEAALLEAAEELQRTLPVAEKVCRHCGRPVVPDGRTSTGWTHYPRPPHPAEGWQGVRCPNRLTGAEV